ncbi:MAG: LPS assembly lipoprotein LptE [Planctomycetota bacterium]
MSISKPVNSKRRVCAHACCVAMLLIGLALSGCGYMVGPSHDMQITTVEVPTFENETFRRGIEQPLTEAVQKEIENRTLIRLARGPEAETRIKGRIVDVRKNVLGETRFDDGREAQLSLIVEVTWEDLRTGQVISQQSIPIDADAVSLYTQADFAPEVGQSMATALQQSYQQTARRIVDMMDAPW